MEPVEIKVVSNLGVSSEEVYITTTTVTLTQFLLLIFDKSPIFVLAFEISQQVLDLRLDPVLELEANSFGSTLKSVWNLLDHASVLFFGEGASHTKAASLD